LLSFLIYCKARNGLGKEDTMAKGRLFYITAVVLSMTACELPLEPLWPREITVSNRSHCEIVVYDREDFVARIPGPGGIEGVQPENPIDGGAFLAAFCEETGVLTRHRWVAMGEVIEFNNSDLGIRR
jgi:hypothetical protein